MSRSRLLALIAVACLAVSAGAVATAVLGANPDRGSGAAARTLADAQADGRPMLVYRSLASASLNQTGLMEADGAGGASALSGLLCERLHFAGGNGVCLARGSGLAAAYRVRVFGRDLRVRHELPLAGIPSRARVSRDGRLGAVTMFVTGHAYAERGAFSTRTSLIDLRSGQEVAELEQFTSTRNGRVVTAEDVNYWGVTFAPDGDTFYATMATGGKTYLIRGSIRNRTARTLHENVECPSLSPDGTRIAFKRRVGDGDVPWRLTVLDLTTMRETRTQETSDFDDQAEWLDDERLVYGVDREIRVVDASGRSAPARLLASASSPAVVR